MRGYGARSAGTGSGTPGTNGNTILSGSGVPDSGLGSSGDFYIDLDSSTLYGPKTAGVWGSGVSLVAPNATLVGTAGSQTLAGPEFQVLATTTDATAVTVDVGYAPTSGHASHIDGSMSATDRTAHTAVFKSITAAIKNYGGTVAMVGSAIVAGTHADTGLSTATVTFAVTSGTLHITFTPPTGYVGTLEWVCDIAMLEN